MNISYTTSKLYVAALFFLLLGCSGQQAGEETHTGHEQEDQHAGQALSVELTERQMEAVGIKLGRFSRLPLRNSVKANGILELPPQNKADVSALVSGAVTSVNVIEGDRVEEGQVLARLEDPHIIDLQQSYVEATEQLDYLQQDYERKKRLSDEGVGSKREFQKVASEYRSTRARATGLRAKHVLLGLDPDQVLEGTISSSVPVRAPLGGYVRLVEVNTGSYVSPGQHLFEVVNNHHIHIDLMVYEKDLHRVGDDQTVLFRYANQPTDRLYKARVFAVGKAFEQDPKAVRVHAELTDRQPDLLPGMYVEAWIVTDSTKVLALPEDAVVSDAGSYYIFVAEEDKHEPVSVEPVAQSNANDHGSWFRAVEVMTGTSDDGFVEIKLLEELPENTEVVTKGAFFVLSEMKKGEGRHHH